MSEKTTKFEEWAVVELFGHQRIAGKVSEATIGGSSFVRVDVPATANKPAYTKFFGNGAIYAMTPCDEELARIAANEIEEYNVPIRVTLPRPALPAGSAPQEDDDDDDCGLPY
jgi:hypothetical protein